MRRWVYSSLLVFIGLWLSVVAPASQAVAPVTQAITQSQAGEPPIAALISVSLPDDEGIVSINGAAGAVFPSAQVAVRNLYTEETIYVNAGITGSFNVQLYGPGSTPFWVSAAPRIDAEFRDRPGSLPGGPGTIVYGSPIDSTTTTSVTELTIDGELGDWSAYRETTVETNRLLALLNSDSFYIAVRDEALRGDFAFLQFRFLADGAVYSVTIDPDTPRAGDVRQVSPTPRNRGIFAVDSAFVGDVAEMRISSSIIDSLIETPGFDSLLLLDENGNVLTTISFNAEGIARNTEVDGAVYPNRVRLQNATSFYVAGPVAQGAGYWFATGRTSTLLPQPGEALTVELDVTLVAPELPLETDNLTMIGELGLQPAFAPGLGTNNGWSNVLTPSGIPIDNLNGDVTLGEARAEWSHVSRRDGALVFGLRFEVTLPNTLPPGLYSPIFKGLTELPNGDVQPWTDAGLYGVGAGLSQLSITRLPIPLNIGGVDETRMVWALLADHPSDGSRGVLAEDDVAQFALSNRTRFNSPTYILPPGTYPVEPYIPNWMPNAYDSTAAPLIPLLYPGGRLEVSVTRPNGATEDLGGSPIVQNRLSTPTLDERTRFGAQGQVDMFRLTTLNPAYTAYSFDAYGEYVINMTGVVEGRRNNRYVGGGTYRLLIADPLDLTPGVLPGTPFEVGDVFYPGATVTPGLPSDITVTLRVYPLDGSDTITQTISGTANRYGVFTPEVGSGFTLDVPGEYVVDYNARYSLDGRLWAASLRGAGIIADPSPDDGLIAHGRRGLAVYTPAEDEARPAWYNTQVYPPTSTEANTDTATYLNYPYFAGDVATYGDSATTGIRPLIQMQDTAGRYSDWLRGSVPGYQSPSGGTLDDALRRDELPASLFLGGAAQPYGAALTPAFIANQAYGYVSAVRPGVSVRQFVHGSDHPALPTYWDADDPLNEQIGAGVGGDRPGDYTFLFGGSVIRNPEAGVMETDIYAALAVVADPTDGRGTRVYPPYRGQAGGPDNGPLLVIRDTEYETFFHPTASRPGQVLTIGDTLSLVGQVAPTIRSRVDMTITAPDGVVRTVIGDTNAIGYFYDPDSDILLDATGLWTIDVTVTPSGVTSIGALEPPLPTGGIVGSATGRYTVYVTRPDAPALDWNRGGDIETSTPAAGLFNFSLTVPSGWTDVTAYRTVTKPGYILDEGSIDIFGTTFSYQYSPPELSRAVPSLEADARGSGASASDVVTITFAASGLDPAGRPAVATRTFVVLHDQIISFENSSEGE